MACGFSSRDRRRCPGRAGNRAAATAPTRRGRRSSRPVSSSPSAAVASAIPESGCRWSTCGGVDQAVHRGVDRRGRAAPAVQAVVERGDHLVFALDAGVDVDQGAQPVQPQHGQPVRGQGAEVAAGSLDPQQLDRLAGDRVGLGALGRGVAAGVVGVARVGAQPVGPGDQLSLTVGLSVIVGAPRIGSRRSARVQPGGRASGQPAWVPPTRSASIWRRSRRPGTRPSGRAAGRGSARHSASAARTSV